MSKQEETKPTLNVRYTLPKSAADVDKLIASAVKSAQTVKVRIQQAAVGILYHAYKHGDYTAANRLVNELGNSVNQKALVEFFVVNGGLIDDNKLAQLRAIVGK